jgi:WD40 repeat protein
MVAVPMAAAQAEAREKEYHEHIETARNHLAKDYCQEALDAVGRARAVEGYERAPEALTLSRDLSSRFPAKSLLAAWETAVLSGHERGVRALVVASEAGVLISGGVEGDVKVWDAETRDWRTILSGHEGPVTSLAVDPAGRLALSGGQDGTLRRWDLENGRAAGLMKMHAGPVHAVLLGPDGRQGYSGGRDGQLVIWNLDQKTGRALKGPKDPILALALRPDGRKLASAGASGAVRIWDLEKGSVDQTLEAGGSPVTTLAFTPDGGRLVTGGQDRLVRVWEPGTEQLPKVLDGHETGVTSLDVGPDGRYILSAGGSRLILWNRITGERCRVFEGHTGSVAAVHFAADGQGAASAGQDGVIRLWHFDWEPDVKPWAYWDDGASPHLIRFLIHHTPVDPKSGRCQGQAQWTDADFEGLMADLRRRGYGWLRSQGVRNQLDERAYFWRGPTDAPAGAPPKRNPRQFLKNLLHSLSQPGPLLTLGVPAAALVFCLFKASEGGWYSFAAMILAAYLIIMAGIRWRWMR